MIIFHTLSIPLNYRHWFVTRFWSCVMNIHTLKIIYSKDCRDLRFSKYFSSKCFSQICKVFMFICRRKSWSTWRLRVITLTHSEGVFFDYSSSPFCMKNKLAPVCLLFVLHPKMLQFAPGIFTTSQKYEEHWNFLLHFTVVNKVLVHLCCHVVSHKT